jgi:flagellar assembly protein FliH
MASVLKQDRLQIGSDMPQPVVFNIDDVQQRARGYLQEVQQQAAAILQQAQQEAQRIKASAHQQALTEAHEEMERRIEERAAQLSQDRCKTAIASCQQTVEQLSQSVAQWLAEWRNQTVLLSSHIAEKLVRHSLSLDNEILRVWMEEAIVAMRDERDVRVLVHPDDFVLAGRFLQNLTKSIPNAGSVTIVPDPQVQQGGCLVRSRNGQIDQQIQTQLRRLVEQLSAGCEPGAEKR